MSDTPYNPGLPPHLHVRDRQLGQLPHQAGGRPGQVRSQGWL